MSLRLGKDRKSFAATRSCYSQIYREYHRRAFEKLCSQLEGYVDTIIISFVDMYKNTAGNQKRMQLQEMRRQDMLDVGKALGSVAERYAVHIQTCAEDIGSFPSYSQGTLYGSKKLERLVQHSLDHIQGKGAICLWLHADG